MVEFTYQMVLSTLQTVALIVGIYYYIMVLRNQQRNQEETLKTRNAAIYQQMMAPITSTEWGVKRALLLEANPVSSHEEWLELVRSKPEYLEAWSWLCTLYEITGSYLRKGIFDIEFFVLHQSYWQLRFWRQQKTIIDKQRERLGPSYYRNMVYLFESMEKYLDEHPELKT